MSYHRQPNNGDTAKLRRKEDERLERLRERGFSLPWETSDPEPTQNLDTRHS